MHDDDRRPSALMPIRSTLLRSLLLLELDRAGRDATVTLTELAEGLARQGFTVLGRPSKVISDHLRCEVARGRVAWVSRGRYRIGALPRTTRWRCHRRLTDAREGRIAPYHRAGARALGQTDGMSEPADGSEVGASDGRPRRCRAEAERGGGVAPPLQRWSALDPADAPGRPERPP